MISDSTIIDIAHFPLVQGGKRYGEDISFYQCRKTGYRQSTFQSDPDENGVRNTFSEMTNTFGSKHYDGFIYAGHSNGITLGVTKKPIFNLSTLTDVIKQIIGRRKLKVICMDSCYGGNLATLLELSRFTKYIVASPSYQDWLSITETDLFYEPKSTNIEAWLVNVLDEYRDKSKITVKKEYPIRLAFYKSKGIKNLVANIQNIRFNFTLHSVLYRDDKYLHDFDTVVGLTEDIDKDKVISWIEQAVVYSPIHEKQRNMLTSRLSIHSSIPTYVEQSDACSLEQFKPYCK